MKILSMAWAIYDSRIPEFCDNCTGGKLVIKNICEYIGRKQESYLFLGRSKLPEMKLDHIHIVGTDYCPDVEDANLDVNEKRLRTMSQAFENAINRIMPDIVNFHGIGILAQKCMEICRDKNIPYVYTDHLFIEENPVFAGYDTNLEWQRSIYSIPELQVIAVSSGMKKKILRSFPQIPSENISVITNGTDFEAELVNSGLSQKYDLENKKVLLCVGTINYRKNQSQIVKTFKLLPTHYRNNIKIVFCGKDRMNGKLLADIVDAGLQNNMFYAGAISSQEMKAYYSIADGLIMPSYAEGLSIAALEAIAYGLPVIMFSDSECAEDLADEKVVCFAKERSDECLARAIAEWYEKNWDRQYIVDYAKYFTMERVADEYIEYYKNILKSNTFPKTNVTKN